MSKQDYIEMAVDWARKKGFDSIKANSDDLDFEKPKTWTRKRKKNEVVPDVTGTKLGKKSYVEIATKDENVTEKVSKWKLLSTLASRKGGKLFLLAPKGHKAFTEKLVKTYNLNAQVVYLKPA